MVRLCVMPCSVGESGISSTLLSRYFVFFLFRILSWFIPKEISSVVRFYRVVAFEVKDCSFLYNIIYNFI